MKSANRTPGALAGTGGKSKWQTLDGAPFTPELEASLGSYGQGDEKIFGSVEREPPNTLSVIFRVKADIARRGRPMPEVVFIAPDHRPETVKNLARKVRALADELANLGSFVVCDRTGDSYIIAGVNEE